jgi:hypothetical protein
MLRKGTVFPKESPINKAAYTRNGVPLWQMPWLSIPQFCTLMRCGRETAMALITEKKITAVWVGQRQKIATDSIRRYLNNEAAALRKLADSD